MRYFICVLNLVFFWIVTSCTSSSDFSGAVGNKKSLPKNDQVDTVEVKTESTAAKDIEDDTIEDPIDEESATYKCPEGHPLSVWLDLDNGKILEKNLLGNILKYKGETSAADNYNYYSASAHPLVGPKPTGFQTNVFFYEGTDGLALTFFSNLDEGGSPSSSFDWDIMTKGNNLADKVLLIDDASQDTLKIEKTENNANYYQGRFRYGYNTDGGVIGPFLGTDFEIHVHILAEGDNTEAKFYSADNSFFSLKDKGGNISSFIIAFDQRCIRND